MKSLLKLLTSALHSLALHSLALTKPRPRLQILSDLHLEINLQYNTYTFPATAPFLLLAGDVGRLADYDLYRAFLEAQAPRYRKIFLVLGNHEFYALSYEAAIDAARRLAAEPSLRDSLVLLHRARWDDPHSPLTVLGCTLWSAIREDAIPRLQRVINDFRRIDGWTPHRHNLAHAEEVSWLREQVAQARHTRGDGGRRLILVATHHAPCKEGTARPEHHDSPWSPAFATDLLHQSDGRWDGVRTWVFGHTHHSTSLRRNGIKLVANQRGYVYPAAAGAHISQRTSKPVRSTHDFDDTLTVTV